MKTRLPALFLAFLGLVLIGYAFMSRAFAYIGVGPIYIGETVLAVGLLTALTGLPLRLLRSPVVWLIALFCAWGAVRTAPYVGTYGADALRDGVLWGYSVFTILVAAALLRTRAVSRAIREYGRWVPRFLVWIPLYFTVVHTLAHRPTTSVFAFKPGDVAVHLAGIAGFALLGLDAAVARRSRRLNACLAGLWLLAFATVTVLNRGGFLAVTAAMLTVAAFRPVHTTQTAVRLGPRLVMPLLVLVAVVSFSTAVLGWGRIGDPGDERDLSLTQLAENVESIFGLGKSAGDLEGTRDWRLQWWTTIENYTLHGRYFWTGKGFGVNLSEDDGFELTDVPLRSPHSAHLNVLARAGVPGLVIWVLLLASFAASMTAGYLRARRAGLDRLAAAHLWVLSYWVAFVVNASFDVYLEGPQGGIWFWSLMGAGLALTFMTRDAAASHDARRSTLQRRRANLPLTSWP